MSLLPLIFSNWWEDLEQPHRLLDQNFGIGVHPESLLSLKIHPALAGLRGPTASYHRPWGEVLRKGESGSSTVKADKDKFHVQLDVQQFAPEEISVKVADRHIVVEGRHEEKQDEHGWISRQFCRRYMIPEQCDSEQVTSKLSSDGILSISVARKEKPAVEGERVVSIEHTGKPAINEANGEKKS